MINKVKHRSFFVYFCVMLIIFTSNAVLLGLIELWREHEKSHAFENGYTYFSIQHETNPLQLPNSPDVLNEFKRLHNLLNESPFLYYEIYSQPLYGLGVNDSIILEKVLSLQISHNVQTDFDLKLSSGRCFNENDFTYNNNDKIPVIMGNDYSSMFNIGDCFTAEYLFNEFSFEVIGFLAEESVISNFNNYMELNNTIIMPSFVFPSLPMSDEEYACQKIHYANKTSGKVKLAQEQLKEAFEYTKNLLSTSEVGTYSFSFLSFEDALVSKGYSLVPIIIVISLIFGITIVFLPYIITRHLFDGSSVFHGNYVVKAISFVCVAYCCSAIVSIRLLAILGFNAKILTHQFYLVILVILFFLAPKYIKKFLVKKTNQLNF